MIGNKGLIPVLMCAHQNRVGPRDGTRRRECVMQTVLIKVKH